MARFLLTLGTFALAAAVGSLMLRGWRARLHRQLDLPAPPTGSAGAPALAPDVPGLFVGTTDARHWLDRIAVHHLADRSSAVLRVRGDGVHLLRQGLPPLFLPWESIESVSVETSLAGKVVSSGMLLLGWRLGARAVVSGFRADDRAQHAFLHDLISSRLPVEAV